AVNESVNLIRAAKLGSAAGFANAVLRRATREADYHPAAEIEDPIEALAVETSHPPWLVERWIEQVGFAETRALARANNDAAPTAFRFTAKTGQQAEAIIDELRAQGAEVRPAPVARNGWRVSRADNEGAGSNIRAVPAPARVLLRKLSAEGLIYFQDEGSQLVAELLRAQSDERVLEVCAAPGSKATLIAALARQATVVAGDIYEHRARTIKEFATQQQAGNVWPVVYDATRPLPFPADSFDRVLVDAPCSGTGTLRHNPEIRWRLQPADIAELAGKQKSILGNAAAMVREGGALVYSTCSLETEENEAVILDFCETHPDFENAPSDGEGGAIWLTDTGAVRTWPHKDEVDGFFVTVLRRKS
ncbi:MAG TPA: hypothetical protein VKD91_09270, partial [Pyrinomonadaceae bacterium]|nr:hypothetical protein [Pyrinomonadaceae bacterium]